MSYHVLVTARSFANTPGRHHEMLEEAGCEVDLRAPSHPYPADELRAMIPGYDGVILGLDACDASVIAAADKLRVISRYGVGVDAVDLAAAARKGIAVTNTPGANQTAVAELALGLLFALARRIPQIASAAAAGVWQRPTGWELSGKTLGVVGFGAIGREVAAKALGLGMRVVAYDPFWSKDVAGVERMDLASLFAQSDVVTLHAAATPETINLINTETLASMKRGAYLINTARGDLVDEAALYAALKEGQLGGAAADAFQHEPPEGSPLLTLENFIATPHIGATTRESVARMAQMASQNLVRVLKGEPGAAIVNGV